MQKLLFQQFRNRHTGLVPREKTAAEQSEAAGATSVSTGLLEYHPGIDCRIGGRERMLFGGHHALQDRTEKTTLAEWPEGISRKQCMFKHRK